MHALCVKYISIVWLVSPFQSVPFLNMIFTSLPWCVYTYQSPSFVGVTTSPSPPVGHTHNVISSVHVVGTLAFITIGAFGSEGSPDSVLVYVILIFSLFSVMSFIVCADLSLHTFTPSLPGNGSASLPIFFVLPEADIRAYLSTPFVSLGPFAAHTSLLYVTFQIRRPCPGVYSSQPLCCRFSI